MDRDEKITLTVGQLDDIVATAVKNAIGAYARTQQTVEGSTPVNKGLFKGIGALYRASVNSLHAVANIVDTACAEGERHARMVAIQHQEQYQRMLIEKGLTPEHLQADREMLEKVRKYNNESLRAIFTDEDY